MIAGVVLCLAGLFLLVLGLMVRTGKFDILRTYHTNQDHSKASYRKAVGFCMIFAAVILSGVGVAAFFVSSTVLFLITVPALVVILVPIFLVQKKYNGQIF